MKKLFLALTVIGLVTLNACKKEEKFEEITENRANDVIGDTGETESKMVKTEELVMELPQFDNDEVQKFAEAYAAFYKEIRTAAISNDEAKVEELQKHSVEWAQKAKQYTQ